VLIIFGHLTLQQYEIAIDVGAFVAHYPILRSVTIETTAKTIKFMKPWQLQSGGIMPSVLTATILRWKVDQNGPQPVVVFDRSDQVRSCTQIKTVQDQCFGCE
jgi:hypothetical protein